MYKYKFLIFSQSDYKPNLAVRMTACQKNGAIQALKTNLTVTGATVRRTRFTRAMEHGLEKETQLTKLSLDPGEGRMAWIFSALLFQTRVVVLGGALLVIVAGH